MGGAETAVIGVLQNLKEYNNVVVTLNDLNEFGEELKYDKYYCLNLKSYYFFPFAIKKLRQIIKDNKVDVVHSQLYWSTVLARFACPARVPLVSSIQSTISDSFEYKKKWISLLDRLSYNNKKSTILGVSNHTLNDYFKFLKVKKQRNYVLYNFVDTKKFSTTTSFKFKNNTECKLITVGNLKVQKNQRFLLEAFIKLKGQNISLDIYGDGPLGSEFANFINDNQLPIKLMGKMENINEVLDKYDIFVMPSLYEGFSLSVLEAMAMKVPLLLSNIASFKEQCADTAVYFDLNNTNDFVTTLVNLSKDQNKLNLMSEQAYKRVLENFTLDHHMASLRKIYKEIEN